MLLDVISAGGLILINVCIINGAKCISPPGKRPTQPHQCRVNVCTWWPRDEDTLQPITPTRLSQCCGFGAGSLPVLRGDGAAPIEAVLGESQNRGAIEVGEDLQDPTKSTHHHRAHSQIH